MECKQLSWTDWEGLARGLGVLQKELERAGMDASAARHEAANEIGRANNLTEKEILSGIGRWAYEKGRAKRESAKKQKVTVPTAEPSNGPVYITDLYESWCAENDEIGPDKMLAHFTGKTSEGFSYARCKLRKEGWDIEKNGNGWIVTQRPTLPEPEPEPVSQSSLDVLYSQLPDGQKQLVHTLLETVLRGLQK